MNLADVFTVVLSITGLLTLFVGWWLAITGLFPQFVAGCSDKLGTAPVKCFAVGLTLAVPLIFGLAALTKISTNPAAKLFSLALMIFLLLLALAGTAGLALRIGQGLPSPDVGDAAWRSVRRGGIVLAITYGTIVLLPLTLLAGLGALALVAAGSGAKSAVSTT